MNKSLMELLGIKVGHSGECTGLYISLQSMYLAQISRSNSNVKIEGLVRIPVPLSEKTVLKPLDLNESFFTDKNNWVAPLQKVLAKKKLKTNKVVVTLSPDFSLMRHFTMPEVERKFWRQSIPLQARKYIHFPFEKASFAYHVYPVQTAISKQSKLGVVFTMTTQNIVRELEAGLKEVGCELSALEIAPFSVTRVFNNYDKEAVGNVGRVYAFFNPTNANLLFVNNRVPLLERNIDVSGPLPIERRRLDVDNFKDFIAKQLEKDPFKESVALGQNLNAWTPVLEADSRKPVRIWNIKEVFGFEPSSIGEIAAIGACSKFTDDTLPDVDINIKNRSTKQEASAILTVWKLVVLLVLVGLAIDGLALLNFFRRTAELAFSSRNTVSVKDFSGLSREAVLAKVTSVENKEKEYLAATSQPPVTYILADLANAALPELWYTRIIYQSGLNPQSMIASGRGLDVEAVIRIGKGDFRKELSESGNFKDALPKFDTFKNMCPQGPDMTYSSEDSSGNGMKFNFRCGGAKR